MVPAFEVRLEAPAIDLVLETVATLVALLVAALGFVRFRHQAAPTGLFLASAFLVLAIAGAVNVVDAVIGLDPMPGTAPSENGQAPLYVLLTARLLVAVLLVMGGIAALGARRPSRPHLVALGPAFAMVVVIAAIKERADSLPSLASSDAAGSLSTSTALATAAQILGAALFVWAAMLSRRLYRRDGSIGHACLAVGLVFGAAAMGFETVYPSMHSGVATVSDLLWLAFAGTLLFGVVAEEDATLAGLRTANRDLERLRTRDVERAALEERAHLSRELHDGLAQNLWFAKLKAGRLAAMPDLGREADALVVELGGAIDAGLAEAQQAVTALRITNEPTGPFWEVVARYVDDFADRFGLRAEVDCPTGRSGLAPRAEAELLRVAQEALSNVHRHADATVVRVRAAVEDGRLELRVDDNGRGFDPASVAAGSYGLSSMRERTTLIGGEFRINSRPHDGTRVRVRVPLPQTAAGSVGTSW